VTPQLGQFRGQGPVGEITAKLSLNDDVRRDLHRQLAVFAPAANRDAARGPVHLHGRARQRTDASHHRHRRPIVLQRLGDSPHDHVPNLVAGDEAQRPVHRGIDASRCRLGVELVNARDRVAVRRVRRMTQQVEEPPLDGIADHMLPTTGLSVHLLPRDADHIHQETLREPVLAHHPGRRLTAHRGQFQMPIIGHHEQAIALHTRDRLRDGRAALTQAFGDARPHRHDPLLLKLEHRSEVHLRGIDEIAHSCLPGFVGRAGAANIPTLATCAPRLQRLALPGAHCPVVPP
jgi:hypothetical protein